MALIASAAAALYLPAAARAATVSATMPFQIDVLACNGDPLHLSGQLHGVFSATFNSAGGVMFASHVQPQGFSGTDAQTGTKYVASGVTRDITVVAPSGTTVFTFVNRFHIQATGGVDSLDVREILHITLLPDGTLTGFADNFSAEC